MMFLLFKKGISIPDDISIIAFDNIPMCESINPSLTTVAQNAGEWALEALKELKDGKGISSVQILSVVWLSEIV